MSVQNVSFYTTNYKQRICSYDNQKKGTIMSKHNYSAPQLKVVTFIVEQGYTIYTPSTLTVNANDGNDGFETMGENTRFGETLSGGAFNNE